MLLITSFNKTRWTEQHISLHCQTLYKISSQMHTGMASHLPKQNVSKATHIQLGFQNYLPHKASSFSVQISASYYIYKFQDFKIKLVDSPICSFCQDAEETLVHLFCECPVSKYFWNEICSWYSCISKSNLTIHSFDICFGHNVHAKPEIILNHLILIPKFYIY